MPNEFRADIPAATLAQAQQHLDALKALLQPYLLSLTPAERKKMLRMADKTLAFVQKSTSYAVSNPAFVPSFLDLAELQQDAAGVAALTPLRQQFEQLSLDLDSTVMTAASEAYANALKLYANIKFLAKNKQPGAQAAFEELRVRFAGQGTPKAKKDGPGPG